MDYNKNDLDTNNQIIQSRPRELSNDYKETKKHSKKFKIIGFCLIIAALTLLSVNAYQYAEGFIANMKSAKAYSKAQELILEKSYDNALKTLNSIEYDNYKDSKSLVYYCNALNDYKKGDIGSAYKKVKVIAIKDEKINQTLNDEIEDFSLGIRDEYKDYKAEQNLIRETISKGVPYVGMSEEYIEKTALGSSSGSVKKGYAVINGKKCPVNNYYFKDGDETIYTVCCANGYVNEVWDCRNNHYNNRNDNYNNRNYNNHNKNYNYHNNGGHHNRYSNRDFSGHHHNGY